MLDYGATFEIDRQPVLPFADLLSQTKSGTIALLPIGAKIKSFKIDNWSRNIAQTADCSTNIDLPNFAELSAYLPSVDGKQTVAQSFVPLLSELQSSARTVKRFWWHWLLLTSKKISILVLLILFQSATQAKDVLENAQIYVDLDSSEAIAIPASSRAYLQDSQASPFNRAIGQAREIAKDSPFYTEAQQDINRWSKTILDIAVGRAGEQDFAGAIAAAELVPQNNSSTKSIARQATEAVENWQLLAERNELYQSYLTQAKASIDPVRASSYNHAIGILRKIAPGAKEYEEAQHLIARWNEQIYLIAKHRAAEGKFKQATEAAILVSEDSLYHQLAKDSIETKIKSIYGVCN